MSAIIEWQWADENPVWSVTIYAVLPCVSTENASFALRSSLTSREKDKWKCNGNAWTGQTSGRADLSVKNSISVMLLLINYPTLVA